MEYDVRGVCVAAFLAGAVLAGGCRREAVGPAPAAEAQGVVEPVAVELAPPAVVPDMPPALISASPPPVKAAPRFMKDSEVPFSICAVTEKRDGSVKVGIIDKQSGSAGLLELGQVFAGYELVSYDTPEFRSW